MAYGSSNFGRSQSYFTWNFSVLDGVMVKIGEKFRPPKKISLPVGWKLYQQPKIDEYDFSFEQEIVKMAMREKEQAEREKEQAEIAIFLYEDDILEKDQTEAEKESIDKDDDYDNDDENTEDGIIENNNDIAEAPILEPVRVSDGPLVPKPNPKPTVTNFNFSEFEDNAATPFELVELQTLDDKDELKSVLQPEAVTKKSKNKSKASIKNTQIEEDPDFSIFNCPIITKTENTSTNSIEVATASLLQGIEPYDVVSSSTVTSTNPNAMRGNTGSPFSLPTSNRFDTNFSVPSGLQSIQLENRFDSVRVCSQNNIQDHSRNFNASSFKVTHTSPDTLGSGGFNSLATSKIGNGNPVEMQPFVTRDFQSMTHQFNPVISDAATNPQIAMSNYGCSRPGVQKFEQGYNMDGLNNTRPGTNLSKSNSKSLPNLAEVAFSAENHGSVSPPEASLPTVNQGTSSPSYSTQEPVVSTSRIDNIMKQFQLNRLREFDGISMLNDPLVSQPIVPTEPFFDDQRPLSRHGSLPPLSAASQHSPVDKFNMNMNSQLPSNESHQRRHLSDDEETRQRNRLSVTDVLPPIRTPSPPCSPKIPPDVVSQIFNRTAMVRKETNSWLLDPTQSLTALQKNYVIAISGMGFPNARTARTVERLNENHKEIIDFLVKVQQISDMNYDADDVEMALINNKTETELEPILSYLNLVGKWKEVGFPIQKIHDALKNTDRENEAVLEYLTR